jgi:hypothetical protein
MTPHLENNVYIKYDYETIKLDVDTINELYQKFNFKTIVIILHSEKNLNLYENTVQVFSYLREKNINCIWVYSGIEGNFDSLGFENVRVFSWPTSHLHTILHYDFPPINQKNNNIQNDTFEKLFLNLNNTDKEHRIFLMDSFSKYNLIDDGLISWNSINNFKHNNHIKTTNWVPELITIDSNFHKLVGSNEHQRIEHRYNTDFYLNNLNRFFIEVVTESEENTDLIRFTEKTWKPILYGKPFLTLSGKQYHNNLEKLGFYSYNEIINYDFDELPIFEINEKTKKICENLLRIKNLDLIKTHEILQSKINHNKKNALDIYKKNKYIDNEFMNFLADNTPRFYEHFFLKKLTMDNEKN